MNPFPRFTPLALLLAASVLSLTCGGDSSTTPAPPPAPPPTPPPAPPPPPEPEPEPPAAPAGLRVSATGLDFIEWSWNPVKGADGYDVQFSAIEAFTDEAEVIARTAEETSYRREELEAGTSYFLRVRSAAGSGEGRITGGWSVPAGGTTQAPEPPPPHFDRVTTDRPDDFPGPQIHAVYAVAADGEDLELDTSGRILEMLGNMQTFMAERIDQVFRIDTFEGQPDVTFVRLREWNESDLIINPLHQGLQRTIPVVDPARLRMALDQEIETDPDKYYAVFYTFDWGLDYITGSANIEGRLAGAYISSTEWVRFDPYLQIVYEVTMIHEVFHLMGAVADCAPNQGRGRHVVDHDLDIMSNSTAPQWEWTYIDYGRDDYYGHGRSDCVDISTSPYFEPTF